MFFKDFVSVKRQKIKRGASQTYDTPSFFSKSHNRYHLSTYSQNLSFIYNKSIIFAAEIKITNKKIKKQREK